MNVETFNLDFENLLLLYYSDETKQYKTTIAIHNLFSKYSVEYLKDKKFKLVRKNSSEYECLIKVN